MVENMMADNMTSDKRRNRLKPGSIARIVTVNMITTMIFFLCLSLLLGLGGWQLRRGFEKAAIEKLRANADYQYITLDRAPPNWSSLAYRRVRLEGDWLGAHDADHDAGYNQDKTFLLANRIHRARLGYEVFSPFRLAADGALLLVNRGWIDHAAIDTLRTSLTQIARHDAGHVAGHVVIMGELYLPTKGFTLGSVYDAQSSAAQLTKQSSKQSALPKVINYLDIPALSTILGSALQPAVVALDAQSRGAFVRIWQPYTMHATRHYAYAAQWWGLAVTLAVFGVIWWRQRQPSRQQQPQPSLQHQSAHNRRPGTR